MAALDLNAMFVLAVPFLAWWAIARLVRAWNGPVLRVPRPSVPMLWVTFAVLMVFGVVRNLPMQPFAWLGTGT